MKTVPGIVLVPGTLTSVIEESEIQDQHRNKNELFESWNAQRRSGQHMLRQLVYGTNAAQRCEHTKVNIEQVDWRAVIDLAEKLHKKERRMLKIVGAPFPESRSSTEPSVHQETHEHARCFPWTAFFLSWFPFARKNGKNKPVVTKPSSFSINLVAYTENDRRTPTKGGLLYTDTCTSQKQAQLQQVVSVGCHTGIFPTFRRVDVNVTAYKVEFHSTFSTECEEKNSGEHKRSRKHLKSNNKVSSGSSHETDLHYSSSVSSSTLEEDLSFLFDDAHVTEK